MTNFKPKCGYLGCNPVVGQCLGLCENAQDKPFAPMPVADEDRQDDDGGFELLAWLIVLVMAIAILAVWRFA